MKKSALIFGLALIGLIAVGGVVSAAGVPNNPGLQRGMGRFGENGHPLGVFGSVSAINGYTLTVQSKGFGPNATSAASTVYTVDATNAAVIKDNATSTISSIAIGDMVMVKGTISGTNVTATSIRDGIPQGRQGDKGQESQNKGSQILPIQGNGQPVVSGSVTAINGNIITITNRSNVTYTIDATNAVIQKDRATSTLSYVATGDNVIVQGIVNGTSVTASSIIDSGSTASGNSQPANHPGVFGGIFGFFQRLFGFF